ncbi:MAG TPA: hypothetical protein VHI32_06575 [Burkholderiales bacterium]|jgi:uncharacterized membrane protein|nr:hypothetical protein [Burkholderiales bacterium]
MEVLLTKPVVVTLAVIGALLSTAASSLQTRNYVSEKTGKAMNYAGYGAMGASMLLFVLAGLWGPR